MIMLIAKPVSHIPMHKIHWKKRPKVGGGRGRTYDYEKFQQSVAQKYSPSPVSNVFTGTKLLPKNRIAIMAPNQPIHWVACSGVSHTAPQRDELTKPPSTAGSATPQKGYF